jgi:hypothetical protein
VALNGRETEREREGRGERAIFNATVNEERERKKSSSGIFCGWVEW